jgi:hypothetical protein
MLKLVGERTDKLLCFYHPPVSSTDYKCKDDDFPMSASCVMNSNPHSLSSSETEVDPEMRIRKSTSLIKLCVYVIGDIYETKK